MHIKTVVLTSEPLEIDTQIHIRPLLDALNSVEGLVDADAFVMSLDHSNIGNNELLIVLEFEKKGTPNIPKDATYDPKDY